MRIGTEFTATEPPISEMHGLEKGALEAIVQSLPEGKRFLEATPNLKTPRPLRLKYKPLSPIGSCAFTLHPALQMSPLTSPTVVRLVCDRAPGYFASKVPLKSRLLVILMSRPFIDLAVR